MRVTTIKNGLNVASNPVFATSPKSTVSIKYQFCSTQTIVQCLESDGWLVDKTQVKRVRDLANVGFQKHQVTLKHPRFEPTSVDAAGGVSPRLVLINDHTGTGAVKMMLGMFRIVCLNGLVVPEGTVESVRFRHSGKDELTTRVLAAAYRIICQYETKVHPAVTKMQNIQLTYEQQQAFAQSAAALVWPDGSRTAIESASDLLHVRRTADEGQDLWTMLNRIQENVLQGGLSIAGSTRHTRRITSIDRDLNINTALMSLALNYAEGRAA